jgi:hypothetical protein
MLWAILLAVASGCTERAADDVGEGPDLSNLAPVSGVITLNGEPLAGAVVTFLPEHWSTAVGECNKKGEFRLSTSDRPGVPPGHYKVAISLLVSAEGEPQGLGPRSSMSPTPGILSAKEMLPREYADLGTTKLTADVPKEGGTFNFDVKAPGLVIDRQPEAGKSAPEPAAAGDNAGEPREKPPAPSGADESAGKAPSPQ